MANYTTSLKSWGASGQEFPDGYSYVEGEQPVDAWDNFFNHHTYTDISHLIDLTNARLADENGSEASAGGVRLQNEEYLAGRNNADNGDVEMWQVNSGDQIRAGDVVRLDDDLLAIHGEVIWDESEGHIPSARIESTAVYSDEKAQDAVGGILSGNFNYDDGANSIDLASSIGVDITGNADTVDGEHASAFADAGHTHALGDLSNVTASGEGSGNGFDADTVDGQHASAFASSGHTHDGRYYTESESDSRFVNESGDTMTGDLTVDGNYFRPPVYSTLSNVGSIPEGSIVYINDENKHYFEDGT